MPQPAGDSRRFEARHGICVEFQMSVVSNNDSGKDDPMPRTIILHILLSFLFLLLSSSAVFSSEWEKLGQRTVKTGNKVVDIPINSETRFQGIKLTIGHVGIYVRKISVFCADGEVIAVEINSAISPKTDTPTILLPDKGKIIKKVRFNYTAKKRSIITLYAY